MVTFFSRSSFLVALLVIISAIVASQVHAKDAQEQTDKPVIRIGGMSDQAFPPFLWQDACTGQMRGVLPALVERILGADYQLNFLPPIPTNPELWKQSLNQLRNNDYDLQLAMYAPAPEDILISSTPLAEYSKSIFYRKGTLTDREKNLGALKNKKGLILQAPKGGAEYRTMIKLQSEGFTIRYQQGIENAINLLASGEVEYVYGEHYYGANAIYRLNYDTMITSFDLIEERKGLYAAVNANGPWTEVIDRLNQELKAIQQTKLVDKLSQSYLSNWLRVDGCD